MKTFTLHSALWLPKPLDEVFPFFADAHNLQRITPPWLRFEVQTPSPIPMKVGQTIDYKLKVHGFPLRWRSEITAWQPPYRFVDEQLKGPYRQWIHEHRFTERDGMTYAEDIVRYAVPGGALIHGLFVKADVERIFAYRTQALEEIFGKAAPERIPSAA